MADSPPGLVDLVERCIRAFERDGEDALAAELATAGELAATCRDHIAALRAAGLLRPPELPDSIGAWRVRKRLGTGGMGTVFLAEQREPIVRRAAIKVIRPGMDTHEILARFAIERQALAMLDHPGIARILDAGRTTDGRPYLAMDYVAGPSILRYCDERQLDTRERLELFVLVCDAVQHAHHKGLLHRDLKPSNILVTDRDGAPFPVVIDFGVAKSVGRPLALEAQLTLPGRLLGTPEYMSPEQAANEVDVDTRTDVYSLGVVLYELLTSTLPIDSSKLRTRDVGQVLREAEPPTPSTRITSLGDAAAAVAAHRRTSVGTLRRALRGDLDWIVMKALERDRNRRYGMPGELAADIGRHLRDEPITAGAPGAWYRLRKFCSRNRLQATAAAMVVGALGTGFVTSTVFYQQAAASAVASSDSLDAALQAVGELVQVGDSDLVTVPHLEPVRRDLLQRSVEFYRRFLDREPATDPRLLPRILDALVRLGHMQIQLGQHDDAVKRLLEVDALLDGPAAAVVPERVRREAEVDALIGRAHILDRGAQPEAALDLLHRATPIARELSQQRPDDAYAEQRLLRTLAFEANLLSDRDPSRAMELLDEALAAARDRHRQQPVEPAWAARVIRIGADRADLLRKAGRRDECLAAVSALRTVRAAQPGHSWPLAQSMLKVVDLLQSCERADDCLEVVDETLPDLERLLADHPSVLAYRQALIALYNARGNAELLRRDFPAALAAQRRVRSECEAGLALAPLDPHLHRQLVVGCINIASYQNEWRSLRGQWDAAEVEAALQRATSVLDALPAGEPQREAREQRMEVRRLWGLWRESQGDRPGACAEARAAVEIAGALAAEAPQSVPLRTRLSEMQRRLASLLLDEGRNQEALAVVDEAVALSASLRTLSEAQARWTYRRRELLLLQMRARGAIGDVEGALAALAEQLQLGADIDWIGRQEAARALARLIASLPAADPARQILAARARELVEEGLAYAPQFLERDAGHGTVAVMRGNTLVIAQQVEQAGGDLRAAARWAGEATEAYAEAWQAVPNERSERRVRDAAAAWFQLLREADDGDGGLAALDRLATLFAGRADSLAFAAALGAGLAKSATEATALAVGTRSVLMLRAALAAGLAPTTLQEERFAPLRSVAGFGELLDRPAAATDKH